MDAIAVNILEKMKNSDTWDDIVKVLNPYLVEVYARVENNTDDDSIIQDFYILELLIETKVTENFSNAIYELIDSVDPIDKEYNNVVADMMKLHRYSNKLNHVLDAHPRLFPEEKYSIRCEWERQGWKTEACEILVEDSEMEELFKAKCDKLADISAKIQPYELQQQKMLDSRKMIYGARGWVKIQKIFRQTSPELHKKYEERIRNIWQDNSCSSTQVKKQDASSEDNKLDEC